MKSIGRKRGFLKYIFTFVGIIAVCVALFFIVFNDNSCTVQYNAMGGVCDVIEIEVNKDAILDLPTPSKEGYEFGGWYNGEEKWNSEDKVTNDLRLTAKWIPKKFDITFIVDGVPTVKSCDYGRLPEIDNAVKNPTTYKEYVFTGWIPEPVIVVGPATYTATFEEVERKYDINVTSNIEGAGTFLGNGEYTYNTPVVLSVSVNKGYRFLGWYTLDEQLYSESIRLNLATTKDINLNAKFEIITYIINYKDVKECVNPNPNEYTIHTLDIELVDLSKDGYNFLGWYTKETGGVKVTIINTENCNNIDIYARWEIEEYNITYILNGGTNNIDNVKTYTIEDQITIKYPTRSGCEFVGWKVNDGNTTIKDFVINLGSVGDITLQAVWNGEAHIISLVVDGFELENDFINVPNGTTASVPNINGVDYNMLGYNIDGWYIDADLTTKFDFSQVINSDKIIYGSWEYILPQGFYPYYDKFSKASLFDQIQINSYNELVAYAEYVEYFEITAKNLIKLTYTTLSGDALFDELGDAILDSTCNSSAVMGYARYETPSVASIYVISSYRSVEATLTADTNREYINKQQDYAYAMKITQTRSSTYNDFAVNKVKDTLNVSTSDQLVYALEKGLRPICEPGSKAETMYNLAKKVLRQIINDDMDTITKVKAIYEWITLNVSYDNLAADDNNIGASWKSYDAWYLEGVFLQRKAVCDGLAKAFVVLAQMENIPAIRVDGNGHAWNKVYINGKWYGIDTTHGDLQVNSEYEILTYTSFLFTDSYKTAQGYSTSDYQDVVANTIFNYYDYATYTFNDEEFDLKIDNLNEFYKLLEYTENYAYTSEYYTVEFALNFQTNIQTLIWSGESVADVDIVMSISTMSDSQGQQICVLFIQ